MPRTSHVRVPGVVRKILGGREVFPAPRRIPARSPRPASCRSEPACVALRHADCVV